ncbi:hypothetical protein ISG33_02700 [Glaciecola sp. MH2013]|uniref:hypothetical protein n=1 Tax=Glaciecola sp. MH2013 TaxID=2785524 RepID=UPI00189DCE7D|nr:hypothetical protein [Glaciecola sp. MH2013]MBF7072312.1 hypothetical protein [Glaciecola sp. MH2013]
MMKVYVKVLSCVSLLFFLYACGKHIAEAEKTKLVEKTIKQDSLKILENISEINEMSELMYSKNESIELHTLLCKVSLSKERREPSNVIDKYCSLMHEAGLTSVSFGKKNPEEVYMIVTQRYFKADSGLIEGLILSYVFEHGKTTELGLNQEFANVEGGIYRYERINGKWSIIAVWVNIFDE